MRAALPGLRKAALPIGLRRRDKRLVFLTWFVFNLVLLAAASWEMQPFSNGFQYDSAIYAIITRQFGAGGLGIRLDDYYIQRLLPCAVVGTAGRFCGGLPSKEFIAWGFRVLDFVAVNAAFWCVAGTLRSYGITGRPRLAGLLLAFGSFAVLKYALYAPVLTDSCAFAIAAALLYTYASNRRGALLVLAAAGAFTHPLLLLTALVLYLFPRGEPGHVSPEFRRLPLWLSFLAAGAYLALCVLAYVFAAGQLAARATSGLAPVQMELFALSAVAAAVWVFCVVRFTAGRSLLTQLIRELQWQRLIPALAVFGGVRYFMHLHTYGHGRLDATAFAANVFYSSITAPLQFLVAHLAFFGPLFLVILLFPRRFGRALSQTGTGPAVLVPAFLLLLLCSESRQLNIAVPFLVLPAALLLRETGLHRTGITVLAVIAAVFCKAWLPLENTWSLLPQHDSGLNQWLYMNMGPWMQFEAYVLQLCAALAAGISLYLVLRPDGNPGLVFGRIRARVLASARDRR